MSGQSSSTRRSTFHAGAFIAAQRRLKTLTVGLYPPRSTWLTYSRVTLARAANSCWVRPAASLALRNSSPSTPAKASY